MTTRKVKYRILDGHGEAYGFGCTKKEAVIHKAEIEEAAVNQQYITTPPTLPLRIIHISRPFQEERR